MVISFKVFVVRRAKWIRFLESLSDMIFFVNFHIEIDLVRFENISKPMIKIIKLMRVKLREITRKWVLAIFYFFNGHNFIP